MSLNPFHYIIHALSNWMAKQSKPSDPPICDFERVRQELQPCDILLIEGRSRMSNAIKFLTHSSWTHATIYIGKLYEIQNEKLREHIANHYHGDPEEPLIIEGMLGKGTLVVPLEKYKTFHLRICRPNGISPEDMQRVTSYCIGAVGYGYNLRQIFDLLRYTFPISLFPRRLFSTLFSPNKDIHHRKICSSLLAEAFQSVEFPVLPKVIINKKGEVELIQRNSNLFSPGDFDYSPYFEIIKYPLFGTTGGSLYHSLPWKDGVISNDEAGLSQQAKGKTTKVVDKKK